jgi:hypothetical protein
VQVYPYSGTVAFGSGLHGWAFTLERFADMYAKKMKHVPKEGQTELDAFKDGKAKLKKKLWGDNYYDAKTKKWHKSNSLDGKALPRGFCKFVLEVRFFFVLRFGFVWFVLFGLFCLFVCLFFFFFDCLGSLFGFFGWFGWFGLVWFGLVFFFSQVANLRLVQQHHEWRAREITQDDRHHRPEAESRREGP